MFHYYKDIKINYETIGSGLDIVFLHGWGATKDIFKPIIQDIKNKYKVTLIDLPSFGMSTSSYNILNVYEVAYSIIDLLKNNNINNPILVGHSYGGKIASIISKEINVNKLILIDSSGIKRVNIINTLKVYFYKLKKKYYKLTKQVMKYNHLLSSSGSNDYKNASLIQKEMLKETLNTDIKHILKKISCETLILWGQNDNTTKLKDAKLFHKLIKNSELVIIPNSAHFPFIENKQYFIKVLNTYLEV